MSGKMYEKIKKQNGEGFAKVIRDFHNGIFEIPEVDKIVKHAGNAAEDAEKQLKYLISLLSQESVKPVAKQDPFVLLDTAGYNAFYADTLEKQNSIKKYFAPSEELCTFRDTQRFMNYFIINCVKKNVDQIIRKDFPNPEREDEYGTSVISIQVSKNGGFISIKNRYNHSVQNCDNTFKSNPDNIIMGLSQAIQDHFNVQFSAKSSALEDNYLLVSGQIVKYHSEFSGIYYGDKCYVKNGTIHEMGEHEYMFDYFIFNASTKTFRIIDQSISDCFPETFNKAYGGSPTVYVKNHCIYDGEIELIGVW